MVIQMVGIICSSHKEKEAARLAEQLLKEIPQNRESVLLFSLTNTDLTAKTAVGSLARGDGVTRAQGTIPPLVFNFASQHTHAGIKKLRGLQELAAVRLLNAANRYEQDAALNILRSSERTRRYALPFRALPAVSDASGAPTAVLPEKELFTGLFGMESFLLKPLKGTQLSTAVYAQKTEDGFLVYNWQGNAAVRLYDVQEALLPLVRKGGWILLETPGLVTENGRLPVTRSYLQKNVEGVWKLLYREQIAAGGSGWAPVWLNHERDTAVLRMMETLGCYLPDLVYACLDTVSTLQGATCFFGFSGWQNSLVSQNSNLSDKRSARVLHAIAENILTYADVLLPD